MVVKKEEGLIEYRFQPVESKFEVDEYRASSIVEKHALLRVEGYQLDRECWRWKLDKAVHLDDPSMRPFFNYDLFGGEKKFLRLNRAGYTGRDARGH